MPVLAPVHHCIDSKMTRLEERMEQLMKMIGNRPQESTGPKIAAYQPTAI